MYHSLPSDILPLILSHLTIPDILRFRLVCRSYLHVTKSYALWFDYIQRHFLRCDLPLPGLDGRSLGELAAQELENLSIKAEKYRRNWSSENPVPTRRVQVTAIPDSRIIALQFFSRREKQWLLSLAMTRHNDLRAFTFQCWDLKSDRPTCIARRVFHHFAGMSFNRLATGRAVAAIMTPECVGFFPSCCLAALTCGGIPLRICLIDIDPVTRTQSGGGVDGDGDSGGNGSLSSNSARSPAQACVSVATLENGASVNLILVGDFVLTQDAVGRTFLCHFETPQTQVELVDLEGNVQPERIIDALVDHNWIIVARSTTVEIYALPTTIDRNVQIEPIGRHRWQWKVDSISLAKPTFMTSSIAPIHLVIRYGSIHPWPVNFIHRYVLRPNDSFDPTRLASKHNFPYTFPPSATQTIGSPIRLLATYDMVVGSHGTIVYTDSHTETYFGHSDFGQRLAGTRIDKRVDDDEGQADMMVRETSVYEITDRDDWTRIALQEQEGRIAIGHVDGRITILDYA